MRLALIGCGVVAAKHAEAVTQSDAAQLEWFCDPREEAARAFAEKYRNGEAKIASQFSQVSLSEVDGLIICSPTADHHLQASEALRAGKHVLCEKPLAANSEQIRDLIRLGDKAKRVISVAFQRRTESPYITARKLIVERSTSLGRLLTIHCFVCEQWAQTIAGTWRDDSRLGFGYFGDAGVHQVDSIVFMTDATPRRVQARGDRRGRQVQVVTDVRSEWQTADYFPVAMTAQFVGDAHHWREDIALCFENADILLRSGEITLCQNNQCEVIKDLAPQTSPVADFLAACRGEQETVAPGECGLTSMLWTESVLASIPEEKWINL